tara:strand:+ start:2746 stop:3162 length:417 start_codon:yes stop_codon:yes gene_type:complete
MSTNSRIGLQLSDGSILSAYHHWDGYPEWLGVTLEEQFNEIQNVAELIDGGDMSSCWSDNVYDYDKQEFVKRKPCPEYYSERGENVPPVLHKNFKDFIKATDRCCGEFAYLFKDNKWHAYQVYNEDTSRPVAIPQEVK